MPNRPMAPRSTETGPDEVLQLLRRAAAGCRAAEARLIATHQPLVRHFAKRYARYGVPQHDLMQEGLIGLLQALRKFDPARGVKLGTYATWWVRAAMQEHVVRSWSLVRLGKTAPHRSLFFALRRKAAELTSGTGQIGEEVLAKLAVRFRLPIAEVKGMAARLGARDAPLPDERDGRGPSAPDPDPEAVALLRSERRHRRGLIESALALLPPREAQIIRRRHLAEAGPSLEALAQELGVSKARVRQLEQRAMARLRELLPRPRPA